MGVNNLKRGKQMAQRNKVIRKIGGSLGVIIGNDILRQARMIEGDRVSIVCEDEKIIIARLTPQTNEKAL